MSHTISSGIWPTMITPFTEDNEVDYAALGNLVEWYISEGAHGLFAICQSSEMFFLSLEERVKIAKFIKDKTENRIPVIATGSVSDTIFEIAVEIKKMSETGVDAVVLLTNRLALQNEGEDVWQNNVEQLLKLLSHDIQLGLYECPHPYKRLLSPRLLSWLASTNRFSFLKDTSCSLVDMEKKLEAVKNTQLKIYNANSATLFDSLKMGVAGFSGVMANFHPDLYVWLYENINEESKKAKKLANFLGVASLIERQLYPVNAKYHMQLLGLPIKLKSRQTNLEKFSTSMIKEVKELYSLTEDIRDVLDITETD